MRSAPASAGPPSASTSIAASCDAPANTNVEKATAVPMPSPFATGVTPATSPNGITPMSIGVNRSHPGAELLSDLGARAAVRRTGCGHPTPAAADGGPIPGSARRTWRQHRGTRRGAANGSSGSRGDAAFEFEQLGLHGGSAQVGTDGPVAAHDAVTRQQERHRVVRAGAADHAHGGGSTERRGHLARSSPSSRSRSGAGARRPLCGTRWRAGDRGRR